MTGFSLGTIIDTIISGAIVGFITSFFNQRYWSKAIATHRSEVTQAGRQITALLNALKRDTDADRAVLIIAENGKIRDPDSPKFMSVIDEVFDRPLDSSANRFYRYRVDNGYRALIADLLEKGYAELIVADMPDGFLKSYYLSKGIQHSYVFTIYETEKRLWYCSVVGLSKLDTGNPATRSAIDVAKHEIADIIQNYPEAAEPLRPLRS